MPRGRQSPLTEFISRKDAIAAGLTRYFIDKPCPRGHVAERKVSGECVECVREKRASIPLEVRRAMRLRAKEREKEAIEAERQRVAALQMVWDARNKEWDAMLKRSEAARLARRAVRRERAILARQALVARGGVAISPYDKSTPEYRGMLIARTALRRATILNAVPPWADLGQIQGIYEEAARQGKEVDHVIPLKGKMVCGLHVQANLQLLDAAANLKKRASFDPAEHEMRW